MHESSDPEAFPTGEQATAPLRTAIDDFTTSFAQYEASHDDVPSRLRAVRRSDRSSPQLLRAFETTIGEFTQRIGRFESNIPRTALNYGLNLLPDDVLYEIFALATTTLEEKVVLSLVCRRFRGIMMSVPKMWDGYWIDSKQTPEQNIAIAEGKRFISLKARIGPSFAVPIHVKARLDLKDHKVRYWKFCVGLILSFGLDELVLSTMLPAWEEIEPVLASANMQNLRSLAISNSVGARLLEKWYMPLLQNLEVNFVPGAAIARNLVRCSLSDIGKAEISPLREFLAAANSLQNLDVFLNGSRFYEVCDVPSLRSLEVNFVPHPSLARRLVRFRLTTSEIRMAELLDFLSSSEALQEFTVNLAFSLDDLGMIDTLLVVTMPSLVSSEIHAMGPILIAKLRMPILRTLKLKLSELHGLSTIARNEFRASLQSMPLLEDLEFMEGDVGLDDLDEIVRYAPPHLESLKGTDLIVVDGDEPRWNTSVLAPYQRLIHFKDCWSLPDFMSSFVDHLRAIGLGRTKIQFSDCQGWRNGTFGLDDVMAAVVYQEEEEEEEEEEEGRRIGLVQILYQTSNNGILAREESFIG